MNVMLLKIVIAVSTLNLLSQACIAQSNEKPRPEGKPPVISAIQCNSATKNIEAEKFCNNGIGLTIKRDYDRAIADFNKAVELDPTFADAYNRRGVAYSSKKDDDRAIADFTNAIELAPTMDTPYLNRGSIYLLNKKDYELAIADFTKLIELNPKSETSYFARALAYDNIGRKDLATADRQKVKELRDAPK